MNCEVFENRLCDALIIVFLTHLWEPCQADNRKPDFYSHNHNNSFTKIKVYTEVQEHELRKNQNERIKSV